MVDMRRARSLLRGILLAGFVAAVLGAGDDSEHQFVYTGFTGAPLSLDGTAVITPTGLLELTNGTAQLKGHAVHPAPLQFQRTPGGPVRSFSASFVFGIIPPYPDLSGHGIVFFVGKDNFSSALPSQYLGLLNPQNNGNATNNIFGVELDTIQSTEFKDPNDNHVGIDINSLKSVSVQTASYYDDKTGAFQNLSLISGKPMQVWVDYDGETMQINVFLAPLKMAKPSKPLVSATHNLSEVLVEPAYVGFSSSTGTVRSLHYVLGWSFAMDGPAPDINIGSLPKLPRFGPKARSKVLDVVLPIATAAFVLGVVVVVISLVRRRLKYAELREDWEVEFGPHRFSYKDLFQATEGFKSKMLLGIGGFGRVYKGVLPKSKLEVAVKRVSHESRQGIKEFVAEVVSIGRLRHRNLVQLLGYCRRKGELLLVYDYMPNGSLDKYLHGHEDKATLDWAQRFRIIKGVASGLLYIHEDWEQVVIHRDIKASNVLLDSEMNGRLGDFGLARLYDHGADPQTTHVVGTMGYLAPELARTGKASPLTDVFAFGAFILEVTCGRRPVEQSMQDNQLMLVDWVLEHWQKESLTEVVDAKLQGKFDADEAILALKLGLLCSHPLPSVRPSMRQVMQYLEGDMPFPELTPSHLSFSMLALMQNEGAYGIAFFVAPTTNFSATLPSQFLGLFNTSNVGNTTNHIFAIELDTLLDVEFADINSNHVGIDIDGLKSVKAASAGYYDDDGNGVFRNLSLISGEAMQVWVDYDGRSMEINVTLAPVRVPKPKKPLFSHAVDLSTVITDTSYIGFAASLGSMSSRHCILGWSFSLNGSAPPLDYSKLPRLPVAHGGGQHKVLEAVLPIGIVVFILAMVTSVFVFGWRRVKYAELREEWEDEFGPRRFTYKDLFHATDGFTDRHLLGVGGFGRVYKGVLPGSKLEVAVKMVSHDSRQGIKEFVAEITSIGRLQHRNLVRLLGYCRRRGELLLVYEYMPNGSLDKFLYDHQRKPTLDWGKRFRILKDVALGLFYLHNNCDQVIIHRDVKASNVLLDDKVGGHLGDFGLARLHDHGANPRTTRVVGTLGYLAPELARTSKATPLTDVFAFGVFLLEVTCGRRPIEEDARGDRALLVDWVLERWSNGSLIGSVDARLDGEYDAGEVSLVLKLGLLCTQVSPVARPSMAQVVQYMDGILRLPEPPVLTPPDFGTMASLQSDGFDSYAMWYPTSSAESRGSYGTVSDLSGGR
ncbi:L-type lectin-domain containing receptor kinase SIT2-like [Phragmites australis]|uniref:L-type lectin-domain containing receptor kinase SIT2-like n=1 Tax=Phragmites australis TaxID=29695 RepID=UPI002D783576|nr:L-type lectin-domain containing receptor kinase SIT2-like [Phragmites australis]